MSVTCSNIRSAQRGRCYAEASVLLYLNLTFQDLRDLEKDIVTSLRESLFVSLRNLSWIITFEKALRLRAHSMMSPTATTLADR
jgi:hypothetical protein